MDYWIYRLYIWHLNIGLKIGSLWNKKARLATEGRKNVWDKLKTFKNAYPEDSIWFHVSSLGELEQAYPLIQRLKEDGETCVVSFFSPSGYTQAHKYADLDFFFYLPLDFKSNARKLIDILQPKKVIWVKYDFWYHILEEINRANIPLYLISATFTKSHFLLQKNRPRLKGQLDFFTHIFVQDQYSKDILADHNFKHSTFAGDTRVDRVLNRLVSIQVEKDVLEFKQDQRLIIFGSVHPPMFDQMADFIKNHSQYRYVIAPHDIDKSTIENIQRIIPSHRYSNKEKGTNVLILDTMGDLFSTYRQADMIYIGGGFGRGIHNILEPTVFGKPVLIGPNYSNFPEAMALLNKQLLYTISTPKAFAEKANKILKESTGINKGLQEFYDRHKGAVETILLSLK